MSNLKFIKVTLTLIFFLVLIISILIYIHGWRYVKFDHDDELIGEKFRFTNPMLKISNLSKDLSGNYINFHIDKIILEKSRWDFFKHLSPNVTIDHIQCGNTFEILDVYYEKSIGLFAPGGSVRFFVIDYNEGQITVMDDIYYENNTEIFIGNISSSSLDCK